MRKFLFNLGDLSVLIRIMWNSNINKELERAFGDKDFGKIKALLYEGADINHRMGRDKGTLLHYTSKVEVTKKLLLSGAKVNARNIYNETPLHSAINLGKGLEIVRELLKHGADVNATNCDGNTPLNLAVRQNRKKLEVIKALLEHGADINVRNRERRPFDNCSTSLDNAQGDMACARLLIKISVINNFDNYKQIVDLTPYTEFRNYSELSRFLDDCVSEIHQMKTDMVNDNFSLYEFVIIKSASIKTLHAGNKITDQVILTNYPIYHEIISAKVKLCLERSNLLYQLSEINIYTSFNQDANEEKVILNFDCAYIIAKYLSNDDLVNLVTAFNKNADQSLDFSVNLVELSQRLDTQLDEVSARSCAKRGRLESPE